MKHVTLLLASLLSLAAGANAATHTEVTMAPRLPFLRGMGFFGFYGYGNDQYARQASVLATLKAKGFDHIRLPVDFRLYSTFDSGTGVATLLDRTYVRPSESWAPRFYAGFSDFDSIIDNAEAAGLYITLDFHGWFDISTTNANDRAQFKAIWRAVAERYKDRSNKLVFELANEPRVNNGTTIAALNTLQKETVAIIRETNPTRLILYAVADANQPWALTQAQNPPNYGWVSYPANDNNLALVIHSYNPGEFTHQGETWANPSYTSQVRLTDSHRSTLNWDLNQITLYRRDHDIPIVLNEFNVSHKVADHDDITEYLSTVTRYCEANGIPWAPWIYYSDGGGMDCFDSGNGTLTGYTEDGLFPDLKTTDKFSTNDYAKAVAITFMGYTGSAPLTNFPALVKLSENIPGFSYADFQKPNGFDLCFTDANGNLIPHEIDTWNTNGVSTVWVKVPSLAVGATVTARYGCAKPIVPKVESVWDDDYVGVWHMGESALPLADSTGVSRDVTSADGTGIGYGSAGVVGGAIDFGAAGSSRCVNMDDHRELDGFTQLTVEAWTKQDAHATNAGIVSKRKGGVSQATFYMFDNGSGTTMGYSTNGTSSKAAGVYLSPVMGRWNHQAYTLDATTASSNSKGYLNGALKGTASVSFPGGLFAGDSELHVGNLHSGNAANFPGQIDEVRISKCVRSADWIQASYDTVTKANFAIYNGEPMDPVTTGIADLLLKASTDKANPIDYVEDEDIRFDFRLDGVAVLPPEVLAKQPTYVIWTRTADDGVTVKGTNEISLIQGFSVTTRLAIPGIVKMTGTLVGNDYKAFEYRNAKNEKKNIAFGGGAGVATEKMQMSAAEPADFDAFWAEAKAKLATVSFPTNGSELTEVFPNTSNTNTYRYYAASIPCFGPRPVTGWLVVPRKPSAGGIPIQASFDGYGCITNAPNLPTSAPGQKVYFAVNAHGYDLIGHDDQYYLDFYNAISKNGRTNGYGLMASDYDNPTNTYFYYMAMRVMRAFDYLKTRPEWNGRDVVATGGSQGGLQTMWAGGLVDGITKIQPSITWGCDIGCPWNGQGPYPSRTWGIPCVPGAFYFDSALHAKRVPRDCIATITRLGMGDYTCPPRGVLLSYYNMKCEVSAYLVQGSDHGYTPLAPNQTFTISKAADPGVSVSLANAVAEPGFAWTNATATVTVADAVSIPEGAKVRLTVSDASGAVLGTMDRDWAGTGEYAFDTAGAIGGAAYADGFDYTFTFSVVDAGGTALVEDTAATSLRLGAEEPWFSADAATATVAGGSWATAPAIQNGAYVIQSGATFTATAGRSGFAHVEYVLPGDGFVSESSLPELLSFADEHAERAGLAAVQGTGGDIVWHGLVQENGALAWKALGSVDGSSAFLRVAVEVDTTGAEPCVSYLVGGMGAEPQPLIRLHDASGTEWFSAPESGTALAGGVDFQGSGPLVGFVGQMLDKAVAESDGVRYDSLAEALATGDVKLLTNAEWPEDAPAGTIAVDNDGHTLLRGGISVSGGTVVVDSGPVAIAGEGTVRVTFATLASVGIATASLTPAQLAAALAEYGANGIPKWESYVLGLDATDPDARPLADIAPGDADGTVDVSARSIAINEDAGANVTYQVWEVPDLADPQREVLVSESASNSVPIEMDRSGAQFFRIKVNIDLE